MSTTVDIEQAASLEAYLRRAGRIGPRETVTSRVLAGGVSNRTVMVTRASGEQWVLKQALDKLRVPVDWFCSPRRIEREALGMLRLFDLAPAGSITRLIFCDAEEHVLAMEAVPAPHENWKAMLLRGDIDARRFAEFGELLGTIHARGAAQADLLAREFEDRSFFEVLRVEPYYAYTAERVPQAAAFLQALIEDTRATRVTIVHGDYSPKNVLVHADRMILIDHEVMHWGDPGFDIGFSMAHVISKARHLPESRAALWAAARIYWDRYRARYVADEPSCVRHTLGCLLARVAGRSQLEYLSAQEKAAQRDAVVNLMAQPPATIPELLAGPLAFSAS